MRIIAGTDSYHSTLAISTVAMGTAAIGMWGPVQDGYRHVGSHPHATHVPLLRAHPLIQIWKAQRHLALPNPFVGKLVPAEERRRRLTRV